MTEEQIKFLCKWAVQNSNRPLTDVEKEMLKQAIDAAKSVEDLLVVALTTMTIN